MIIKIVSSQAWGQLQNSFQLHLQLLPQQLSEINYNYNYDTLNYNYNCKVASC